MRLFPGPTVTEQLEQRLSAMKASYQALPQSQLEGLRSSMEAGVRPFVVNPELGTQKRKVQRFSMSERLLLFYCVVHRMDFPLKSFRGALKRAQRQAALRAAFLSQSSTQLASLQRKAEPVLASRTRADPGVKLFIFITLYI